jgi:hypothetical protein
MVITHVQRIFVRLSEYGMMYLTKKQKIFNIINSAEQKQKKKKKKIDCTDADGGRGGGMTPSWSLASI